MTYQIKQDKCCGACGASRRLPDNIFAQIKLVFGNEAQRMRALESLPLENKINFTDIHCTHESACMVACIQMRPDAACIPAMRKRRQHLRPQSAALGALVGK